MIGLSVMLVTGCALAPTTNLLDPTSPRFEGSYAPAAVADPVADTPLPVRVVTFNIKLARRIDRAITVLQGDSLRGADILTLVEMDERGVDQIARSLGLNYVYYPGVIHPIDNRYFGPAILTRWPIERSWKLVLPHEGKVRRQRRTATAATVRVRGRPIRVYAVHLETQLRVSEKERHDQMLTIIADAAAFPGPVVIAGDVNSHSIGPLLERHGYDWTTEMVGPTVAFFSWDHIFVRGLTPANPPSFGVVRKVEGASDHRPVWAVVVPSATPPTDSTASGR